MGNWLIEHEMLVRLSAFSLILLLMCCWERLAPRRPSRLPKSLRWPANFGILLLNTLVLRLLFPAAAVGLAALAAANDWGLLNRLELAWLPALLLSLLLLDLAIYLQHRLFHAVPLLWRLHRVHHSDADVDVSTGLRFHPLEIVLSMLIKFAVIYLLGPPVVAVLIFEVLLNGLAMFNHGNVRMPQALDRVLRLLIVTPDMHRVHHSVHQAETDSNFGFNLSVWDRLFSTYVPQPQDGHEGMKTGLLHYNNSRQIARMPGMLLMPFTGSKRQQDAGGR